MSILQMGVPNIFYISIYSLFQGDDDDEQEE